MKNQYYADSLDVAKWTVLVRLAREHSLTTIMQIAMLTPNDESVQGRQRNDPQDADPIVDRFFAEERSVISKDPSVKQIDRVTRLGAQFQPPFNITVVSDPFRSTERGSYFDTACEHISSAGLQIVAFVDPDIGIASGRPSDKHVTEGELSYIWSSLKPGSLLIVFQYQQRRKGWVNDSNQRFAGALQVHLENVREHTYPRVSFVFAQKME